MQEGSRSVTTQANPLLTIKTKALLATLFSEHNFNSDVEFNIADPTAPATARSLAVYPITPSYALLIRGSLHTPTSNSSQLV